MRRTLKIVVLIPVAVVLIALAVANRGLTTLSFDPFGAGSPALAVTVPLFWIVFGSLAVGVLLGGCTVWLRQRRFRKAARREHQEAERLRREAERRRTREATALPAPAGRSAI